MKSTAQRWGMRKMANRPPKEKITVSVDKANYAYLKRPFVNASGLIDVLVKKYRDGEIEL